LILRGSTKTRLPQLDRKLKWLDQGHDVPTDPRKDLGKAKFVLLHRAIYEHVTIQSFYLDIKAVPAQEDIGCGKSDALIVVEEAVVVAKRLHQRCRFFVEGIVMASLRTKDSGLNSTLIADTMKTAEQLDQAMLHPVDFGYREVIRHLLGKSLQQVTVAGNRLLERIHHLWADQVLGWNHVVQVEAERLLQHMPLRLPIPLGYSYELVVELGVDLGCEHEEIPGGDGWGSMGAANLGPSEGWCPATPNMVGFWTVGGSEWR